MESSPEVVVAAEALRTWVRTQREGWTAPQTASRLAAAPPSAEALASAERPVAAVRTPEPAPVAATVTAKPPVQAAPTAGPRAAAPPFVAPRPIPVEPAAPEVVVPAAVSSVVGSPLSIGAASTSAASHPGVFERPAPADQDDEPVRETGRGWVRMAAAMAAVLVLGAGVFLLRGRAGQIATAPKSGTAVLTSEPAGADVVIDGKASGTTPLTLNLSPGQHELEFRLKSSTRKQTITVAKGQETTVEIDWDSKPLGSLKVDARPTPARVLVDGKDRGAAPVTLTDLTVGTHTVQIETVEGSVRRTVKIAEGRTESLSEEIFPGWLQVSSPIELTVVDGKRAVQLDASKRVLLRPGPHTIRLENSALEISETRQVTIEPGGTAKVSVDPQESTLSVTGSTGADVFVDGARAGQTPLVDFKVRLGSHDVMVVDRGGATRHASVTVTARPATVEIVF